MAMMVMLRMGVPGCNAIAFVLEDGVREGCEEVGLGVGAAGVHCWFGRS